MRHRRKGFSLIDCLTALFIALVGLAGSLAIIMQSHKAYARDRDLRVAWELASHLQRITPQRLQLYGERWYDARGFPGERGAKYRVRVTVTRERAMTRYEGEVAFADVEGQPRRLLFTRLDWKPE